MEGARLGAVAEGSGRKSRDHDGSKSQDAAEEESADANHETEESEEDEESSDQEDFQTDASQEQIAAVCAEMREALLPRAHHFYSVKEYEREWSCEFLAAFSRRFSDWADRGSFYSWFGLAPLQFDGHCPTDWMQVADPHCDLEFLAHMYDRCVGWEGITCIIYADGETTIPSRKNRAR